MEIRTMHARGPLRWRRVALRAALPLLVAAGCGPASDGEAPPEPCDAPGTYLVEETRTCYCTEAGTKVCAGEVPAMNSDGDPIDVIARPS